MQQSTDEKAVKEREARSKAKGKKKAKYDEDDDSMVVDSTDPIAKEEGDEDVQWTTCEYYLIQSI